MHLGRVMYLGKVGYAVGKGDAHCGLNFKLRVINAAARLTGDEFNIIHGT
jgi:hypothetical protein